jgi:hypothetical protein
MAICLMPVILIMVEVSTNRALILVPRYTQAFHMPYHTKGSWWQVDLGQSIPVKAVKIFIIPNCCTTSQFPGQLTGNIISSLSNSIVSLQDNEDTTIATYRIRDASGLSRIEIDRSAFRPNYGASAYSMWKYSVQKIKIQLTKYEVLSLAEVQVYDNMDANVALGKSSRHSPATYENDRFPASVAVNGNIDDYTHTSVSSSKHRN